MKKWDEILIDVSTLDNILTAIENNENTNPACKLIDYWKGRMGIAMIEEVKRTEKLPYGFVGGGWPKKATQVWEIIGERRGLRKAFLYIDSRDVGDAIYQTNTIIDNMIETEKIVIVDIGSGYGRLAIPFIYHYRGRITYIGIDYSPIGLLTAPQFVSQAIDANCRSWDSKDVNILNYDFVSLPAWRINELFGLGTIDINAFVSIHSFQEMERETVDYYVDIMDFLQKGSVFYSVNLWPEDEYVKSRWELIFNRAFPINRDGSYNEKMWRIK